MSESEIKKEKKEKRKKKKHERLAKVQSNWHDRMVREWKDHYSSNFEESMETLDLEIGVTFDQKLLYLTCFILGFVGPTVQITFILAIILFYLSESMLVTNCKVRNRPVFFADMSWNSWILRHGGIADAILGWHYVMVYTLQTVLGVLVLCDKYVFVVHSMTQERLMKDDHCIYYSQKPFKTLVFIPIWFIAGVMTTGSAKQQKKERQNVTAIADWCMRIEIIGLIYLGKDVWTGWHSFSVLVKAYKEFKLLPIINVLPLAIIILHQYWINIPKTFGKPKKEKQGCSSYNMRGVYTARLIIICVFLGLIQPFYLPYEKFREHEEDCQPFWKALHSFFPRCFLYLVRVVHIMSSAYIGTHFACRALVDLAKSDLTVSWFLIKNPINGAPIVAIITVSLFVGAVSSTLGLYKLLYLQGLNIMFSRAILALTILLRERYSRPVVKVLKSAFNQTTEDVTVEIKQWSKISAENGIVFIFFFVAVLGIFGVMIMSEFLFPYVWEGDAVSIAVFLVLMLVALSPLFYIMTVICMKKNKDEYSMTKWEMFICVTMYITNVTMTTVGLLICSIIFFCFLGIGIILYMYAYGRRLKEMKKEHLLEEMNLKKNPN